MPTVLSDPSPTLYIVLAAVVVLLGSIAARRQKRADVINFAIPAVALLAPFLIDRFFESPREAVERTLSETNSLARNKKYEQATAILSPNFKALELDKNAVVLAAKSAEGSGFLEGIGIESSGRKGFHQVDPTTVEQEFDLYPTNMPLKRYNCVGTFKLEDGKWRLFTAKVFEIEQGGQRRELTHLPAIP